jgi:hypothetical protein
MSGAILIYSCQKYKDSRLKDLARLRDDYSGWKVFFIVGDPTIVPEYSLDGNVLTLRCEDSYLHLLKKTILGFKAALELVPNLTGVLKCGDDIVFDEPELLRFLQQETKHDYMGIQGSPFVVPSGKHYDSWIVDYYKKHPEDFENPFHKLPSMDVVKTLFEVPTIQAASGPLTYFSRQSCELLVGHMIDIEWDILTYSHRFGYIYIIEEPGISFILYQHGIRPHQYRTFTESRAQFQTGKYIGLHTNSHKWSTPARVCILGAGWYGCHAARYLLAKGFSVHLMDAQGIFCGASAKNQNRLHLGYHYPRSIETIKECEVGHAKFIQTYGDCVRSFPKNFYLIHDDSKTSVDTFRERFKDNSHIETTLPFESRYVHPTVFAVEEKCIDNAAVKTKMERDLIVDIQSSPKVEVCDMHVKVNGNEYDYVLNCTNNQYVPIPLPFKPIYETVCSLLYTIEFQEPVGLTVMDGPFFSIFPYDMDNQIYTVTHVVHSVVSRGETLNEPVFAIDDIRANIERDMFRVFPSLRVSYVGYFTSKKTKYDFENDDRSLRWFSKGRYSSFSGGKITGIFEMESILDKLVNTMKVNV